MMKYRIFKLNDEPTVVYVEDGKNLMQFSADKNNDEFFKGWVTTARDAGQTVNLESVSSGWTYYTFEDGDYAKDKAKVAKIIKGFGHDAP